MKSAACCGNRCRRAGLTLVEVTVSTALVGLIVVGALRCLTASVRSANSAANTTLATLLAEDLMEEILQQDYLEPGDTPEFGREGDEDDNTRIAWDDVDDYDNWRASPPEDSDGNPIADAGWERAVVVQHVAASDLNDIRSDASDTGIKKITVTVSREGIVLSELVSIQTTAWISMIPEYGESATTGQLPPANEAPTASVVSSDVSGTGYVTVTFDAGNSSDPEDQPLEFEWDFGDDDTDVGQNVAHTFHNDSNETLVFNVTLIVKDIHGGSDSATLTVTVYPNP